MKRNVNRPIRTTSSLAVDVFASVTMIGFSIYGAPYIWQEFKTGHAYSLGVVFGDSHKIAQSNSPAAFWMSVVLPALGFLGMFICSVFVLREVVIEYKRKVAAKKERAKSPSA